jgi:drug/metabolite transporter (DMT)-like permease
VSKLSAGILLAVLSVIMYTVGMVMEKLATRRLPAIHARRSIQLVKTLVRDPLWLLGFVFLALGLATQALALTLAPISIAQAVASCGVAFFLVLSHFVLGERLGKIEYVGIIAILSSLVLLTLSVDAHDDLVSGSPSLLMIFAVGGPAFLCSIVFFILADRFEGSSFGEARLKAPIFGLSSGLMYGVASLGLKEVSTLVKKYGLLHSIPHIVVSPGFYLLGVGCVLGFLVFQTALQHTTASVFVPVNNVSSSGYFIVAGSFLFHERLPSATGPLLLRLGAFALIVAGMCILAFGKKDDVTIEVPDDEATLEEVPESAVTGELGADVPEPAIESVEPTTDPVTLSPAM